MRTGFPTFQTFIDQLSTRKLSASARFAANLPKYPTDVASSLGFKKGGETGLPKMMIRGESIANAKLAHDSETDAIGEGPLFVAMFAEPTGSGVKTCRINPFQAEHLAAFDCVQKIYGSPMAVAHQQQ